MFAASRSVVSLSGRGIVLGVDFEKKMDVHDAASHTSLETAISERLGLELLSQRAATCECIVAIMGLETSTNNSKFNNCLVPLSLFVLSRIVSLLSINGFGSSSCESQSINW